MNNKLDIRKQLSKAVSHYWKTRNKQSEQQGQSGVKDHGSRSAVTGGAQMNGFIDLFAEITLAAGIPENCIHRNSHLELPGFFRPTKEWDILVIKNNSLLLAIEAKSQVGPSFGNNFNNRTEEAMGSALDLWTAYREGAYNKIYRPWLGYFFMLEDCPQSLKPVKVKEPHFKVFPEFHNASYAKRYELFCRKLTRENHYSAASFLLSKSTDGAKGLYSEPTTDLSFDIFVRSLHGQLVAFGSK